MEFLNEFVSIDGDYFKIIESLQLLKAEMVDIDKVTLDTLDSILAIAKGQRVCLAQVAKYYNVDVTKYNGVPENYDPVSIISSITNDGYFKELNNKMDDFIVRIDTEKVFQKYPVNL
jgi:hypothetical protein